MTLTPDEAPALEVRILRKCRNYVIVHWNDLETSDYYRLQADLYDILDRDPNMAAVDNILHAMHSQAMVANNDDVEGVCAMGDPDRGASVSRFMDETEQHIREELGALTWKGIYA